MALMMRSSCSLFPSGLAPLPPEGVFGFHTPDGGVSPNFVFVNASTPRRWWSRRSSIRSGEMRARGCLLRSSVYQDCHTLPAS